MVHCLTVLLFFFFLLYNNISNNNNTRNNKNVMEHNLVPKECTVFKYNF